MSSADYVLVTFVVTEDGEQAHPMNSFVTCVDLVDGEATSESIQRVTDRIRREARAEGERIRSRREVRSGRDDMVGQIMQEAMEVIDAER